MKKIFSIFLISLSVLSIFSCKEDDSLAISQDQLLRAQKWQLKEVRTVVNNVTTTDKLLDCERQSTLDFTDVEKYFSVAYNTVSGSCNQSSTDGKYIYTTTGTNRRILAVTPTNGTVKNYYVEQLDPYFLILQETTTVGETVTRILHVYQPKK